MTGVRPESDQGAAKQAYEAAARLHDEAAAERSEGPRCREGRRTLGRRWGISARRDSGWRSRLVPTVSRRGSSDGCSWRFAA